jgi:hypothetical protein
VRRSSLYSRRYLGLRRRKLAPNLSSPKFASRASQDRRIRELQPNRRRILTGQETVQGLNQSVILLIPASNFTQGEEHCRSADRAISAISVESGSSERAHRARRATSWRSTLRDKASSETRSGGHGPTGGELKRF